MGAWPDMPDGVTDRPADVWETLLAVVDAAGGTWPDRPRGVRDAGGRVQGVRLVGVPDGVDGTKEPLPGGIGEGFRPW